MPRAAFLPQVQPADRFLDVEMPERFELQIQSKDGTWIGEAICLRRRFEHLGDGSYICSEFSTATWIRCVAHHGDHFEHVDGGGQVHRYRLEALPMFSPIT